MIGRKWIAPAVGAMTLAASLSFGIGAAHADPVRTTYWRCDTIRGDWNKYLAKDQVFGCPDGFIRVVDSYTGKYYWVDGMCANQKWFAYRWRDVNKILAACKGFRPL